MGIFGTIFGQQQTKVREMIENGAVIIDVRSPSEFQGGHVAGSKNIPLQTIQNKLEEIRKIGKPVVLCCASGNRSGQATKFLQNAGIECENGGGWMSVNALTQK